jgi:hypothetical protein
LTLVTIKSHGQCSVLAGKFEAGHGFQKSVRHELDPKNESKTNELISLVKIDSIGSTNSSWYAAILFHDSSTGQIDLEIEFQNKKTIKVRGQRPRLSQLDKMYFEDNELVFPINNLDFNSMLNSDIVSIRIGNQTELLAFSPEKNLLRRLTKCLM